MPANLAKNGKKRNDARSDYEKLTGVPYSPDSWRDYVHPMDWGNFDRELRRYRKLGKFCLVYRLKMQSGRYQHVEGYAERTDSPGGRVKEWGYVQKLAVGDREHVCQSSMCYCFLEIH